MTREAYESELERRIARLDRRIEEARERLAQGAAGDKVQATADLKVLEDQRDRLRARLTQLTREPDSTWENLKAELERDIDGLVNALELWIERS